MVVNRSPPKSAEKQQDTNSHLQTKENARDSKRLRSEMEDEAADDTFEPTMKELFHAIMKNNAAIKKSSDEQLSKFEEMRNEVNSKIDNANARIDVIATDVEKINDDVDILKSKLNDLDQDKFLDFMDITGISESVAKQFKSEAIALAHEIIKGYKINYDRSIIKRAYIREIKLLNKFVLVVVFSDYDEKMKIIKSKRDLNDPGTIFFDHSMTPSTRKLLMTAKRRVKEIGARSAFLSRGRVFVAPNETSKIRINTFDDIKALKAVKPATESPIAMTVDQQSNLMD